MITYRNIAEYRDLIAEAASPDTNLERLTELSKANYGADAVRLAVAQNPNTPRELLKEMANRESGGGNWNPLVTKEIETQLGLHCINTYDCFDSSAHPGLLQMFFVADGPFAGEFLAADLHPGEKAEIMSSGGVSVIYEADPVDPSLVEAEEARVDSGQERATANAAISEIAERNGMLPKLQLRFVKFVSPDGERRLRKAKQDWEEFKLNQLRNT